MQVTMPKKNKYPEKIKIWIEARNKYHLTNAQVSMARQLGLNPKKFGKLSNSEQQPWKLPLPLYIEKIYYKHYKTKLPDNVRSIEQQFREQKAKKLKKHNQKMEKKNTTEIVNEK
jgi:hypothetical protein